MQYRMIVNLPSSFIATESHKNALMKLVEKEHGTGWQLKSVDMTARKAVFMKPIEGDDGQVHEIIGTTNVVKITDATKLDDLQLWIKRKYGEEWSLVDVDSLNKRAHYRALTQLEQRTSDVVSKALKTKPWTLAVAEQKDGSVKLKLPAGYDPVQDEKMQQLVETSVGAYGWAWMANPQLREAVIKPGKPPTFPAVVAPKVTGPFSWSELYVGESLGDRVDPKSKPLFTDFEAAPHMLVSGMTGGGKSVFVTNVLVQALLSGWDIAIIEPSKQGIDYQVFRPWVPTSYFAVTLDTAAELANNLVDLMDSRMAQIRNAGKQKWMELDGQIKPLMVVIDEFSTLTTSIPVPKGLDKESELYVQLTTENMERGVISAQTQKLLQTARSAGIFVLVATQTANQNTGVGPALRNLMGCRVLMGASVTETMRKSALTYPESSPQIPTWLDKKVLKGVGIYEAEGVPTSVFRSVYVGLNSVTQILRSVQKKPTVV
jgi:hypothetical protein